MKKLAVTFCTLLFIQVQSVVADFYVIPVAPNIGTEIRSLPYTISSSGFYYLKKDLSINSVSTAIFVNADDVTIDLLGHTITGYGSGNVHGIFMQGRSNVEIRNGTIKNFGGFGIIENDNGGAGQNHRVLNMRVINNGFDGISLAGKGYLVKGCTAVNNVVDGIDVGSGSTVIGNISRHNGYDGIVCSDHCLIQSNTAYDNSLSGSYSNIVSCATCTMADNVAP